MGIKDEIKARVKYILETENNENVLQQLSEDLASYQVGLSITGHELRTDFTEEELEETDAAYERAKDPDNLVPNEQVMQRLWERIEQYSGNEERSKD